MTAFRPGASPPPVDTAMRLEGILIQPSRDPVDGSKLFPPERNSAHAEHGLLVVKVNVGVNHRVGTGHEKPHRLAAEQLPAPGVLVVNRGGDAVAVVVAG